MKRKATKLIHPVQPTEPGVLPHFGAAKTPLYASSTYLFESAEAGAATFALQQGRAVEHEPAPFNYARLGHPNLVQVEGQLVALEGRERGQIGGMPDEALAFESGMAAITTSLLALVKPGSVLAYTTPIYGGTLQFFKDFLEPWGIQCLPLRQGQPTESHDPAPSPIPDILYIETPANPTNEQWSWDRMRTWVDQWASNGKRPVVMADNTYLGPCWQHPLEEGADLVLYSATKSMSGHSDLVCGACVGDASLVRRIRPLRNKLGNTASPFTAWLLSRSLETVQLRMQAAQSNARIIAQRLSQHPGIQSLAYPGSGAMLSIWLNGGEDHRIAWRFLNSLRCVQQAVSLGSNESLACHPASTTHSAMDPKERKEFRITDNLVRLSVGIEDVEDLWEDLQQALEQAFAAG
ncbi:MAG: PLP-dependent transferase [Sphingobacteriia bacterium]|nr:PLP-dependent transferase [Sphingobacteriia bacterium]